jgi:hypothetical protein
MTNEVSVNPSMVVGSGRIIWMMAPLSADKTVIL